MKNLRKRILFTILSGILLHIASGNSSSYAQAATVDFAGTWNTVIGKGKKIVLTLKSVDRRTSVTGTYGQNLLTASYMPPDGSVTAFVKVSATTAVPEMQTLNSIKGTVTDNVLRFKWRQEDGGHGAGRFTMSSDGQSFEGTFSLTDNPDDTSGGTWNGTRAPNFQGAWQTTAGGKVQFPDLLLQQGGNQVSGLLSVNRPDLGMIRDGIIDGNTLRFTIWRSRSNIPNAYPDQYVGSGELVMDKGSKSFKGTILGTSTSGTRLSSR